MLKKWYIGTFIIVLTLLGAVCEQQITTPNQEIVLEFADVELTSEGAQSTITTVKKQLQNFGASNIQVSETKNGTLKITYYSDADVESIKNAFSKDKKLDVDFIAHNQEDQSSEFPFDENPISYNLDVYEIQKGHDTDWDFNGISATEFELKSDRFFEPNVYVSNNKIAVRELNNIVKEAQKIFQNIAIAINNTSHKIPEGRAGPIC